MLSHPCPQIINPRPGLMDQCLDRRLNAEGFKIIIKPSFTPAAAKGILNKYAEDSKGAFSLKTGYMDGAVLELDALTAIAKLPDYKGMLSMFAGALTSTLSGLAVAMQAYVDKQEEPAA